MMEQVPMAALRLCEKERDEAKSQVRKMKKALRQWEKYADYIAGKQVVAPLWDNLLFDEAFQQTRVALGK